MALSQTNSATQTAQQNRQRAIDQGNWIWNTGQSLLPGAIGTTQQEQNEAQKQYTSFGSGTGAYDTGAYFRNTAQNQANIATGGYNPQQLAQLQGDVESEVGTGGYTQDQIAALEGTGGLDLSQQANIRQQYQNLATTGGISDETAAAIERQAASGVGSVYSTAAQNLRRSGAASGTEVGGETAQMTRQVAQQEAQAITGAEAQIGQLRQAGMIAGTGGLAQFEQQTAGGIRQSAADIAAGRRAGVDVEAGVAGGVARGTLTATQAQQDLDTGAAQQRIQAAGGLVNLYNSNPAYVTNLIGSLLQSQQVTGTLSAEDSQILYELSRNPGLAQTIIGDVTALGGAAGGVLKGVGSIIKP